jgi:hypothetical protein
MMAGYLMRSQQHRCSQDFLNDLDPVKISGYQIQN